MSSERRGRVDKGSPFSQCRVAASWVGLSADRRAYHMLGKRDSRWVCGGVVCLVRGDIVRSCLLAVECHYWTLRILLCVTFPSRLAGYASSPLVAHHGIDIWCRFSMLNVTLTREQGWSKLHLELRPQSSMILEPAVRSRE